jgi:hypothetical protein
MSDEYEYGPWVGWNNGSCGPWPSETVEVVMLGGLGATRREIMKSHDVAWTRGNIIAYRIATPTPKRELQVGKWYRAADHRGDKWRMCLWKAPRGHVWLTDTDDARQPLNFPIDYVTKHMIDWSTPPRDEAPNE